MDDFEYIGIYNRLMDHFGAKMIATYLGRFVLLFFVGVSSSQATSYSWNDCTLPLYAYPYFLEDFERAAQKLPSSYVQEIFDKNALHAKKIEKHVLMLKDWLGSKDINKLADDNEKKEYLDKFFEYKSYINEFGNIATNKYKDLDSARFYIVYDLYKSTGKEIASKKGIKANILPTVTTSCKIDQELTRETIKMTLNKLEALIGERP